MSQPCVTLLAGMVPQRSGLTSVECSRSPSCRWVVMQGKTDLNKGRIKGESCTLGFRWGGMQAFYSHGGTLGLPFPSVSSSFAAEAAAFSTSRHNSLGERHLKIHLVIPAAIQFGFVCAKTVDDQQTAAPACQAPTK